MFEEPIFERGHLPLEGRTRLEVPANAVVQVGGEGEAVRFWLEKNLSFMGHPPGPMSIRTGRKYMGLAQKGDCLATYGEFATFEGGASLKLVLEVPPQLAVTRRQELSGEGSLAAGECAPEPDCYWYGSTRPQQGWRAVPTMADPDGRAASAVTPQEELRRRLAESPAAQAVGERLFELKTLLDSASSFQRGVDARLLQSFEEILADVRPLHGELYEAGQPARAALAAGDCAAAYEWFQKATDVFPWNLESEAGSHYLEETTRSMQEVADQLMARLQTQLAGDSENPMARRMGMMLKLMKWQGRCAVRLTGAVEKGSEMELLSRMLNQFSDEPNPALQLPENRWLVNLDLTAEDGAKVYLSGATDRSAGRLEVSPEVDGNTYNSDERQHPLQLEQLTLEVDENARANGRFAFQVAALGKRATGSFTNFPVMIFRAMDLVALPEGEPDEGPQATVELTWH